MSAARLLTAALRLPGRRFPVPGWSLVTERLHPHLAGSATEAVHRTQWGVTLRLDLNDYTQRRIYYDALEARELNLVARLLRPGDVMVDVGANVGIFSLVAARAVGSTGVVHAFEPVPANYDRLAENVELNGFQNVRLNRAAVGPGGGTVTLGIDEGMQPAGASHMSGAYAVGVGLRAVSAPVIRLDEHLPPGRQVRLLKMDIEGFEPRALAGMATTLAEHRVDVVLIEVSVYNLSRQGFSVADEIDPLDRAGYRLYRSAAPGWLRRWRYGGEPSIPKRGARAPGFLAHVTMGIQDLGRHFNLVAVRGDHPAVRHDPGRLRVSSL